MTQATPPVFSVIIATYNWSSALRLALRSVLNQTFSDFEVLVVGVDWTEISPWPTAPFPSSPLREAFEEAWRST